jgi:hypothetical protein
MTCHSHFKGWATSLHFYAEAFPAERGHPKSAPALPAGTVPNASLPPDQRLSWYVPILSFSEHDDVYKQFDLARGPGDPVNRLATSHRFRWMVCPSSGEYYDHNAGGKWLSPAPLTHYVGVAGVGADAATLPTGHPRAGAFGHDRRAAIPDDIPDGTSNTLLLIETSHDPGHWAWGGPPTVRAFEPVTAPYIGPGRPFGGWHNGSAVLVGGRTHLCTAAMADTSVRSLTGGTAPEVLEALATAGEKEPVPEGW